LRLRDEVTTLFLFKKKKNLRKLVVEKKYDEITDLLKANPSRLMELIKLLDDQDEKVRANAAGALSRMAMGGVDVSEAKPKLIKLLDDPNEWARTRAVEALSRMALGGVDVSEAKPKLIKLLDDPNEWARTNVAQTLGRMALGGVDVSEAKPKLIKLLDDKEGLVWIRAAGALGRMAESGVDANLGALLEPKHLVIDKLGSRSEAKTVSNRLSEFEEARVVKPTPAIVKPLQPEKPPEAIVACDICNKPVPRGEGYILTTQQVVYSPAYWEHTFKQRWPGIPMERVEPALPLLAQRQAAQQSDWLVCNECIFVFDIDRKQARRYRQEYRATGKAPLIPGAGAADMTQAAMAADQGWERAFGSKPKVSSASIVLAIAKDRGKKHQVFTKKLVLENASDLLRKSRDDCSAYLKTNDIDLLRSSCERGWLAVVSAVDELLVTRGLLVKRGVSGRERRAAIQEAKVKAKQEAKVMELRIYDRYDARLTPLDTMQTRLGVDELKVELDKVERYLEDIRRLLAPKE